jgi:STE24 endopeptidase
MEEKKKTDDIKFTVDEIKAIVAHELGHWKNKDQYKTMIFNTVEFGIMFYMFSLIINNRAILKSFGFTETSNFASLIIFMKIYEILIFFTAKIMTQVVRRMEFNADTYAAT